MDRNVLGAPRVPRYTGDVLLLDSDGLPDMLAAILMEEPQPEQASRRLVGEANNTALVAR
jgi:hypothetical protein